MRSAVVAIVACGSLLVTGIALGAGLISPNDPTLTACISSKGAVRVVAPSTTTCEKGETLVSWNKEGPAGPSGSPGAEGSPGPQGSPGAKGDPGDSFAGQSCPTDQVVTGFAADGTLQCAVLPTASPSASPTPTPTTTVAPCSQVSNPSSGESEPNDAPTCAHALASSPTSPTTVGGSLTAGDQDWYQLPTVPGGAVLARTAGYNCTADTVLELLDGAGTVLESNDDTSSGFCSDLSGLVRLPSAAMYLRVRGFNATSAGAYTLGYMTSASSCSASADGDDERACGRVIPTSSSRSGGLPSGDVDWYRFTLGNAETRDVQLTTSTADCANRVTSDTLLELRSEADQLLASNDDIANTGNYCSQTQRSVSGYGWFFAAVRPFQGYTVPSYSLSRGSQ